MANTEAAAASLGPRYAPDDPTLPKPWKGLIDGSTGILYYWNPETNVTQYERPAAVAPPLPTGPPPAGSMPKLAPIPMARSMQSNGLLVQQGQQVNQTLQQQVQQIPLSTQQHGQVGGQHQASHMVQPSQAGPQGMQQSSQMAQSVQHQGQLGQQQPQQQQQLRQQMLQFPVQQMAQQLGSQTQAQSQPQGQQMPLQPILQTQHQGQQMTQQTTLQMQPQGQQMTQQTTLQMQPQGQQMPQQPNLQTQHQGQQMPQQTTLQTQHQGQQMTQQPLLQTQHLGQQMMHQHGQHFSHQQLHQMPYQQTPPRPQGQQMPQQQVQHYTHQQEQPFSHQQGQQFHQQVQKTGYPQREDIEFHQGKQLGISPSQSQLPRASSLHDMPVHSVQVSSIGVQSVQQQYGTSSLNRPESGSSLAQLPQNGDDLILRQQIGGTMSRNHMGPSIVQNQQSGGLPNMLKRSTEEEASGRPAGDYYFSANKDGPMMAPPQPSLPAVPMGRNQQEIRIGGIPPHIAPPGHIGGLNAAAGHGMPNMFSHGAMAQPFPNNLNMRPPMRMLSSPEVSNPSPADVYRQQHEVTATGDNVPAPFMTFEATGFPPEILREMHLAGFSSPTPIQAQTWPIALLNRDIVAIAKTGSGKTLGYLLPAFIHLRRCRNNPQNGPTVLVLAPTRELATQIQDEVVKFGRSSRITCTCLYGGAPKGVQIRELDRGAEIVVATPGRLNDILEMKKIDFRQVSFLVLDEADRMLDMGFEPQIRKIVNEIPPRRQTLMYTATWPKEVRKIAGDLLVNPVQVNIGNVDELAANKSITQYVEVVPQMQKQMRLEQILREQERGSKIIIFCSTKRSCDQLARSIGRSFGAAAIHGDKSQGERDWVLNQFRSGKSPILVATDVAARGLDIKDIRVVINYDFPTGIEDYVHRIGRTGRAGATGISYTFFCDQDWKYAADLVKVLEGANQRVPPEVREMAIRGASGFSKGRGGFSRPDGGRWDIGGRGGERDVGFGGRDGSFGGRGGHRDGSFGVRGGDRNGSFGGRGGDRDGSFGSRGGRRDFFGGRGNRGRGFSGPSNGPVGWGRHDRGGTQERYNNMDRRGRYETRMGTASKSRGRSYSRSYSPSPERVSTWNHRRSQSRSRSRSRGRSRSQSRSRSWSRGRSHSRTYSRSRSRSRSRNENYKRSRSRSRSRSYDRFESSNKQNVDQKTVGDLGYGTPLDSTMSPMSPGTGGICSLTGIETPLVQQQVNVAAIPGASTDTLEPSIISAADPN